MPTRRRRNTTGHGERDLSNLTLDNLLSLPITSGTLLPPDPFEGPRIDPVEDLRTWSPDPAPWPRSRNGGRARISSSVSSSSTQTLPRGPNLSFSSPRGVMICVRRKERREVLHALNKAGRGGFRRPRRSWKSNIRC